MIFNMIGGGNSLDWPPSTIVAGNTPVAMSGSGETTATYMASMNMSITIKKDGTYKFKWTMGNWYVDEQLAHVHEYATRLYKKGAGAFSPQAVGSEKHFSTSDPTGKKLFSVDCEETLANLAEGDIIYLYGKTPADYGGTAPIASPGLIACISGDNGF